MDIQDFKNALSYLDIKEDAVMDNGKFSLDKFKEAFNGDKGFFRKENLKSIIKGDDKLMAEITGSRVGGIDTALNRAIKSSGLQLPDELKEESIEKKLEFFYKESGKKSTDRIKELEQELSTKDVDAAVKEYKTKADKLESKNRDLQALLEKTGLDLAAEKQGRADFEKGIHIKTTHETALSKIKFSKDVDELKKEGFLSILSKNYKLDYDENNKVVPFTLDGKRIPHPSKASAFAEVEDIYEQEAVKNKLVASEQAQKFVSNLGANSKVVDAGTGNGLPERKTFRELK